MGYNSDAAMMTIWVYLYLFSRCWLPNLQFSRNSKRIPAYSRSRLSKVIDLGVSGKCTFDFLLVINSNFSRISYHFRDIDTQTYKMVCFLHPSLVWRTRSEEPVRYIITVPVLQQMILKSVPITSQNCYRCTRYTM